MMRGYSEEDQGDDERGRFTNGPQIFPIEIGDAEDDEVDSLLREVSTDQARTSNGMESASNTPTSGRHRLNAILSRNFNFRHRENAAPASDKAQHEQQQNYYYYANAMRGMLRESIGNTSALRNVALLAAMALCAAIFVHVLNTDLEHESMADTEWKPHSPSLGGSNNPGHYQQQQNGENDDLQDEDGDDEFRFVDDDGTMPDFVLPKSNVGTSTVSSFHRPNQDNEQGHYLHDPLKSPYASPLYATEDNETAAQRRQADFDAAMARVVEMYGRWEVIKSGGDAPVMDLKDPPLSLFLNASNKDLDVGLFPYNAWQSNPNYVEGFLEQAKKLVGRAKEGIYAEYGYGVLNETSTANINRIKARRLQEFQVIITDLDENNGKSNNNNKNYNNVQTANGVAFDTSKDDDAKIPGIAYLNSAGWNGLIRKLLHAMMTQDKFYVVVAGAAGPTYASNNLFQSQVMQFNYVMEPIFDKLGIKLVSRNMGMNASTTIAALGGADIYGEADIFWHIGGGGPDANSRDASGIVDLLHKQAILSGERMPVILTPHPVDILRDTENKAWMGNIQPGADFCDVTTMRKGKVVVPNVKACQYVNCDAKAVTAGACDKHNSVCWVERNDQSPDTSQDADVGFQNSGYPNDQQQRLEGRKLTMLMLHALDEALDKWKDQSDQGIYPLPNDAWHVGEAYAEIRETVRTLDRSACDYLLRRLNPSICHMEMHAFTEWTPRVDPSTRLKSLVTHDIADNHGSLVEVYKGIDLLPKQWEFTLEDKDAPVHMIAIAADKESLKQAGDAAPLDSDFEDYHGDDDDWLYATDRGDNREDHDFGFDDDRLLYRDRELMETPSSQRRQTLTSDVSQKAWTVFNAPLGFCDGSAQSRCHRSITNTCLLANHNHYRAGIIGHAQSGKLALSIPLVKEGIVLARFEWELEDGPRIGNLPPDFRLDISVNGKKTSYNKNEFARSMMDIARGLRVMPLMMDKQMSQTARQSKTVNIELEVFSLKQVTRPLVLLSHIYYA